MRKICKIIIILIIFNFIFASFYNVIQAVDGETQTDTSTDTQSDSTDDTDADTQTDSENTEESDDSFSYSRDDFNALMQKGTATIETEDGSLVKKIGNSDSSMGSGAGKVTSTAVPFVATLDKWFAEFLINGGLTYTAEVNGKQESGSDYGVDKNGLLTISSLVFGEFIILNGKPYETTQSLNPSITPTKVISIVDTTKEKVITFFNIFRYIVVALSLIMFVYALVRVLGAQTSRDLAAWKKVFGRWLLGLFLIFFIPYILIAMNTLNDTIVNILWEARIKMESNGYRGFEVALFDDISNNVINTGGTLSLAYGLEYLFLTILQIVFLLKYAFRALLLMISFAVAPIIILIHSVNVMIGKDSTILKGFFKEYASNLYMQPLHALLYLVFLFSASEIAITIPVLGIILLYALYRGEKIVKLILDMETGISVLL